MVKKTKEKHPQSLPESEEFTEDDWVNYGSSKGKKTLYEYDEYYYDDSWEREHYTANRGGWRSYEPKVDIQAVKKAIEDQLCTRFKSEMPFQELHVLSVRDEGKWYKPNYIFQFSCIGAVAGQYKGEFSFNKAIISINKCSDEEKEVIQMKIKSGFSLYGSDRADVHEQEERLTFLAKFVTSLGKLRVFIDYDDGDCASADMETLKISIPDGDYSITAVDDWILKKALMYHESAHLKFSKNIKHVTLKIQKKKEEYKGNIMAAVIRHVMNAVEDHRIEHQMSLEFPQIKPLFLKNPSQHRDKILMNIKLKKKKIEDPIAIFYLALEKRMDIITGIPLGAEALPYAQQAYKYVQDKHPEFKDYTWREIVIVAEKVFEIMFPFYLENGFNMDKGMGVLKPIRSMGAYEDEQGFEVKGGSKAKFDKAGEKRRGKSARSSGSDRDKDKKEGERPHGEVEWERDQKTVRRIITSRVDVRVERLAKHEFLNRGCGSIINEDMARRQGRQIANELKRVLKLKEVLLKNRKKGDLDMRKYLKQQVKYGELVDMRTFKKRIVHQEPHSVCVICDFSGSMGRRKVDSSDDHDHEKVSYAKQAFATLGEFLNCLNVPFSLRGFSAFPYQNVILDVVIKDFKDNSFDFATINKANPWKEIKEKGRAVDALENNDGASIRLATEYLAMQCGKKYLFVISDGMPSHSGAFSNANSSEETLLAIADAEARGIKIIGISVDRCADWFIQQAYRHNFVIDDLKKFPRQLIDIYLRSSHG